MWLRGLSTGLQTKGSLVHSQSGHMPGLWVSPQLETSEREPMFLLHIEVSLPLFLPPFSSKNNKILKKILRFYLYTFLERGKEEEREGEKHQCVVASHVPPSGDLAHNPGMCTRNRTSDSLVLRPALNPLSHTSQGTISKF